MVTEKTETYSARKNIMFYIQNSKLSPARKEISSEVTSRKKINIWKIPYYHLPNFVDGSSLPVYETDCFLVALSCNYIMIYVGSTNSFSQKFILFFKEFGDFCCIPSSYEASIDVNELLP